MNGFEVLDENEYIAGPDGLGMYYSTNGKIPSFNGRESTSLCYGTAYVYCHSGSITIHSWTANRKFRLHAGEYGRVRTPISSMADGIASVLFVFSPNRGTRLTGGPIEETGRLKYIDGCTDSLIIPPDKMGDPCLNHLHFPDRIDQTAHTHPTVRIGLIAKGRGFCHHDDNQITQLTEGLAFCLWPETVHKFRTTDSTMDVIAFHPDSDTGPADENHPMVNRTYVDGISAATIDEIRTK